MLDLFDDLEPVRGTVRVNSRKMDAEAIASAKRRYIAFDTETTGLSPDRDRIIEVGAVMFENGEIVKEYGSLINAHVKVPEGASAVNHITDDMLENAPGEESVYGELAAFFGDAMDGETVICAHNAKFDMAFLKDAFERMGFDAKLSYSDTLALSRTYLKTLINHKQDTVAHHFGFVNECAHRATTDAEVCGKIFWELLKIKEEKDKKGL